ncbi:MAG: cysteine desulfurase family protein [Lachnospiraceae bacterium]
MEVYLDNSATTKCFDSVIELMSDIMRNHYGNPASMHKMGIDAEDYIRYAKQVISKNLKVEEKEIVFTSGGTESDNLAIIGTAFANERAGKHIITTKIEHPAVLDVMTYLETKGFEVTYLSVDEYGCIFLEELKESLREDTILVSIMHTNNEIGATQPLTQIGKIIKEYNEKIAFHVDAVQGYGKCYIFPKRVGIDLLSVSGHKLHGPKGVGFLYINSKIKISPLFHGGGQQMGIRSGTENVPSIAGMAKAIEECYKNLKDDVERMYSLRNHFIKGLLLIEHVKINCMEESFSAPHIISASVFGIKSEVLLHALEEKGIYVSAGSACAAKKHKTSGTLLAIGADKEMLDSTIRFSISTFTTKEEIDYTLESLYDIIPMLRKYTRH